MSKCAVRHLSLRAPGRHCVAKSHGTSVGVGVDSWPRRLYSIISKLRSRQLADNRVHPWLRPWEDRIAATCLRPDATAADRPYRGTGPCPGHHASTGAGTSQPSGPPQPDRTGSPGPVPCAATIAAGRKVEPERVPGADHADRRPRRPIPSLRPQCLLPLRLGQPDPEPALCLQQPHLPASGRSVRWP